MKQKRICITEDFMCIYCSQIITQNFLFYYSVSRNRPSNQRQVAYSQNMNNAINTSQTLPYNKNFNNVISQHNKVSILR